jgi:hypothetical protein
MKDLSSVAVAIIHPLFLSPSPVMTLAMLSALILHYILISEFASH